MAEKPRADASKIALALPADRIAKYENKTASR